MLQVGRGARFRGAIRGKGVALIFGEMEGETEFFGDLVVASGGRVHIRGKVLRMRIEGSAGGRIRVRENLDLAPGGILSGEIEAGWIQVAEGARVDALVRVRPARREQDSAGGKPQDQAPKSDR